jgi:hypothetical protein
VFDIFFIVSLFLFSVLCFFEVLIFNEEVLLALCFFSFIFFSFNSLGGSVVDIFQSRATKFESDLLLSFNLSMQTVVKAFNNYFATCEFESKFKILSVTITNYLNIATKYSSFKLTRLLFTISSSKLSELVAFESKLVGLFQKKVFHFCCIL